MVGVVIFKNFEHGSYSDMRITMYNGDSFSAMNEAGEFSSCTINLDRRSLKYDFISDDNAPVMGMDAALELASKARAYLYEQPHITMAEFCISGTEYRFRPSSVKDGVYAPADFQSVFKRGSFFMLCADCKTRTFSWCSALCEGLNFTLQRIFDTSAQIFVTTAGGVYINIAGYMYSRRVRKHLELSKAIRKALKDSGTPGYRIPLRPANTEKLAFEGRVSAHPRIRLLYNYRLYKCKVYNYTADRIKNIRTCGHMIQLVLSLPADQEIRRMTDDFAASLREYTDKFHEYGYLSAKAHSDMLTVREALSLSADTKVMNTISQAASSRSSNMKIYKNVPCAPYYGWDGSAYWN